MKPTYNMTKREKAEEICSILGVQPDVNHIGSGSSGFTGKGLSEVLKQLRDSDDKDGEFFWEGMPDGKNSKTTEGGSSE